MTTCKASAAAYIYERRSTLDLTVKTRNFESLSMKAIAERHTGYDSPCYMYSNFIIFGVGVSHCLSRQGGNARP